MILKRVPDYQPYADAIPLVFPRGGAWWQRLSQFARSWGGAILILGAINIIAIIYFAGVFSNPVAAAKKAMEMLAVQQVVTARESGAADGELMTKLNSELMTLRAENESLKSLVKKSSSSSSDLVSISKLNLVGNSVYWQTLIKTQSSATSELLLDVRSYKDPVHLPDLNVGGKLIQVKAGGDLFDGNTNMYGGNYLVVSVWEKETKRLVEAKIIKVR